MLIFIIIADSDEKKLKNVELALELIGEAGCKLTTKVRPHDIVHNDVKSTLRVIYSMYEKFIKNLNKPLNSSIHFLLH